MLWSLSLADSEWGAGLGAEPSLAWETPCVCFLGVSLSVYTEHLCVWTSVCLFPIYRITTPPFNRFGVRECVTVWASLSPVKVLSFCTLIRSEWLLLVMGSVVGSSTISRINITAKEPLHRQTHTIQVLECVCMNGALLGGVWRDKEMWKGFCSFLWRLITDGSFVLSTGHAV